MPPKRRHVDQGTPRLRRIARQRLGRLSKNQVAPATYQRYQTALESFLQWLATLGVPLAVSFRGFDLQMAEFIEHLWASGATRSVAGYVISGAQFFLRAKRVFPVSWALWATWGKLEVPRRAPPLPAYAWGAWLEFCFWRSEFSFAAVLLLGFVGLLRTAELLSLQRWQLQWHGTALHIHLPKTKSGARHGETENVIITEPPVSMLLHTLLGARAPAALVWPYSASQFRQRFASMASSLGMNLWNLQPYSLRRGGATAQFLQHHNYDSLMDRGRWKHLRTCRLYVDQSRELLMQLSLPPAVDERLRLLNAQLAQRLRQ
eukprot:6459666-Amphidinium_carterae.1